MNRRGGGTNVAFLDRDGVLNVDTGHPHRVSEFEWVPGAPEAVLLLNQRGYRVAVITNQAGIAKGLYREEDYLAFTKHLTDQLAARGGRIDAVYHCPHHPQGHVEALTVVCECRKPSPGMILRGLADLGGARETSFLIGDRPSDIAAAEAAGIKGHLFDGVNLLEFLGRIIKVGG